MPREGGHRQAVEECESSPAHGLAHVWAAITSADLAANFFFWARYAKPGRVASIYTT